MLFPPILAMLLGKLLQAELMPFTTIQQLMIAFTASSTIGTRWLIRVAFALLGGMCLVIMNGRR